MNRIFLSVLLLACLFVFCTANAQELILAGPKRPAPIIHHAAEVEDQELYALDDLRYYLERIGGIAPQAGGSPRAGQVVISIGNVPENAGLAAVIAEQKLGEEGFVIDISENAVRIVGGSKFGTAFGVYELLERLGVRWVFPGEWGEVVPAPGELRLPLGRISDRPVFAVRRMATAYADQKIGAWMRRHRHNSRGFGGHSGLVSPKKYGVDHPEWYALLNGVRQNENSHFKLCHSNPEMVRQAGEDVLELIRRRKANPGIRTHGGYPHKEADYTQISISPTDGAGFCQCAECAKMGTISDRLQIFANTISSIVRKEFPEHSIGYYGAYSDAQMPPVVLADPGVIVYATTWTRNFFHPITSPLNTPFRQKIESFFKQCPRMGIRDFDALGKWWGYGPLSLADVHAIDYPWYAQHGVEGVISEAGIGWGPYGYSYYMMSKLWWNPYADLEALKRDFVTHAYGESFAPMWSYYRKLDEVKVHPTPIVLHAMRTDLEEAARLAKRPDVRRRIDYLRAYLYIWDIYEKKGQGTATDAQLAQAIRLLRTIDSSVSPLSEARFSKEMIEDASLLALNADELHEFLNGIELPEPGSPLKQWSSEGDLRLIAYSEKEADPSSDLGMNFRFGPHTLLIQAKAGEMLEVWQEGSSHTAYQLYGPELALMDEGVASGDGAVLVKRPAPGDGIYTLTFSTGGSRPRLHVSNQRVVAKAASSQDRLHPFGKAEQYFYVPKGTKEFAIISKAWEPFTMEITGPGGETDIYPKTEQKAQIFVEHRVEVPEGLDGDVWKIILKGGKKELFLLGVPPFLASEPSRLLIPPQAP